MDRSICPSPFFTRIDGEIHHRARYARYPAMLGIGVLPASDPAQEQIFHTLASRCATNLYAHAPASAVIYRSGDPAAAAAALCSMPYLSERRSA